MSVSIQGSYKGGLGVQMIHGPSGTKISTAAPVDNQGDGSSFSPTDLVAGGLGACMLTIIAIVAERDGLDVSGMSFEVQKHMTSSPRRIEKVEILIHMPSGIPVAQRGKLERAAMTCPVKNTLSAETQTPVSFEYR